MSSMLVILEEDLRLPIQDADLLDVILIIEDQFVEMEAQVIWHTNRLRQENGLRQLTPNGELQLSARGHSRELAQRRLITHTGANGSQPADRMQLAGYRYWLSVGENVAVGKLTPAGVVRAWYESPGHRANLLNPAFDEIGVGIERGEGPFGLPGESLYWTQNFGLRPMQRIRHSFGLGQQELLDRIHIYPEE